MPSDVEPPSSALKWLTSWKLSAVFLVFFCFSLPDVLRSSVPWSALAYPGFFIAMPASNILSHFAGWDKRPLPALLPLAIYMVLTTVAMFVFFVATDEPYYRRSALVSMIFSVPVGAAGVFLFMKRNDPRWPGREPAD